MDAKEALRQGGSPDSGADSADEQSKSLIANTYSNDGTRDPDPYKKLTDWGLDESEIQLAYLVTKGQGAGNEGLVRDAAATLATSGSHEEWYSELQMNLAHYIGNIMGVSLPNGEEPEGPVNLFEQLDFDGGDIMEFLREHPEEIQHLDSEELAELRDEWEQEQEEEAAAESDD